MPSNDDDKKNPQINFVLDTDLRNDLFALKEYYKISTNADMVRLCIKIAHRQMLREKKELGLDRILE
jgi:hypothetical protein